MTERSSGRDGRGEAVLEDEDGEVFSKGDLSTLVNSKGNLHAPVVLQEGPAPSLLLLTCTSSMSSANKNGRGSRPS